MFGKQKRKRTILTIPTPTLTTMTTTTTTLHHKPPRTLHRAWGPRGQGVGPGRCRPIRQRTRRVTRGPSWSGWFLKTRYLTNVQTRSDSSWRRGALFWTKRAHDWRCLPAHAPRVASPSPPSPRSRRSGRLPSPRRGKRVGQRCARWRPALKIMSLKCPNLSHSFSGKPRRFTGRGSSCAASGQTVPKPKPRRGSARSSRRCCARPSGQHSRASFALCKTISSSPLWLC
mmetsp:Transcript_12216/g.45460  ORF Transcript_12216/g.45460 Transcript_12216/m.45460 type:complete len:229 (+) Transcript_12216:2623-3309(+)